MRQVCVGTAAPHSLLNGVLERGSTTFRGPDFQVLGRILLLENDSKRYTLASLNSIAGRSECPTDEC